MCAIAGIYSYRGEAVAAEDLRAMIGPLRHRGPEADGILASGNVGLAHARLAIIDLAGGAQPMQSADGALAIAFNGEIYNFVELREELEAAGRIFRTRSDTEVILHLYAEMGERCVERFNGQWAFAIWDARAGRLFLARDRVGVQPLFYAEHGGRLLFASEIKGLLAAPGPAPELDCAALAEIFTFWSAGAPATVARGVRQLPPGHTMTVGPEGARIRRYWAPDYSAIDEGMGEEEAADRLLELLDDATRIRLRADVPVAAYLSGGLDSSVIAALAQRHAAGRLTTYSVRFPDPRYDEGDYQRQMVERLGSAHRETQCGPQDICAALPRVVWHAETPLLRTAPAPLYRLSGLVHDDGCKVVLTGEGADEFLGGYDIFKEAKIRRFCAGQPQSRWRPLLLRRLYPWLESVQAQSDAYRSAFFRVGAADPSDPLFSHRPRWEMTQGLQGLLTDEVRAEAARSGPMAALEAALPPAFRSWDGFSRSQYLEATGLLPGYLLSTQGDRMTMAHSVEGRYPYLDHRIIELSTRMPPRLKMKVLDEKHVLKRAAAHLVPRTVTARPKQPYRAPDAESLFDFTTGTARASYVEDMLAPERIRRDGIFKPQAVDILVKKARRGRATGIRDNMALVGVLSTQLWIEQFRKRKGEAPDGQG